MSDIYAYGFVGSHIDGVDVPQVVPVLRTLEEGQLLIEVPNGEEVEISTDDCTLMTSKLRLLQDFGALKAEEDVYSFEELDEEGFLNVRNTLGLRERVPSSLLLKLETY